VAYPERDMETT